MSVFDAVKMRPRNKADSIYLAASLNLSKHISKIAKKRHKHGCEGWDIMSATIRSYVIEVEQAAILVNSSSIPTLYPNQLFISNDDDATRPVRLISPRKNIPLSVQCRFFEKTGSSINPRGKEMMESMARGIPEQSEEEEGILIKLLRTSKSENEEQIEAYGKELDIELDEWAINNTNVTIFPTIFIGMHRDLSISAKLILLQTLTASTVVSGEQIRRNATSLAECYTVSDEYAGATSAAYDDKVRVIVDEIESVMHILFTPLLFTETGLLLDRIVKVTNNSKTKDTTMSAKIKNILTKRII